MTQKKAKSKNPGLVAANVLSSWLRALGIQHRRISDSLFEVEGQIFRLRDGGGGDSDFDVIDSRAMASAHLPTALSALHVVTRAVGRGTPDPTRGYTPYRRDYGASKMTSALRLSEYTHAPDLSEADIEGYRLVASRTIRKFMGSCGNRRELQRLGMDLGDLLTQADIWATSFHHRYRREGDNEQTWSLFGNYLRQRLVFLLQTRPADIRIESLEDPEREIGAVAAQSDDPSVDVENMRLLMEARDLDHSTLQIRIQRAVEGDPALKRGVKKLMEMIEAR